MREEGVDVGADSCRHAKAGVGGDFVADPVPDGLVGIEIVATSGQSDQAHVQGRTSQVGAHRVPVLVRHRDSERPWRSLHCRTWCCLRACCPRGGSLSVRIRPTFAHLAQTDAVRPQFSADSAPVPPAPLSPICRASGVIAHAMVCSYVDFSPGTLARNCWSRPFSRASAPLSSC